MKKRAALVITLIVGLLVAIYTREYAKYLPFGQFHVEDITYAVQDTEEAIWIADLAGERLIKLEDGEIKFCLEGGSDKNGFHEAAEIITDEQQNLYVRDIVRGSGGFITGEHIIKYSGKGAYQSTILTIEHEELVMTSDIARLFIMDGRFYYLLRDEHGVVLYDENNQKVKEYAYENAVQALVSFAFQPESGELVFLTKSGEIYQYDELGNHVLLYSADESDEFSVPRDITYDALGNLYFVDVGSSSIQMLSDGQVYKIMTGELHYYSIAGGERVTTATSEWIMGINGTAVRPLGGSFVISDYCQVMGFVWLAATIVLAICVLLLAFLGLKYLWRMKSSSVRISAAVISIVVLTAGIFIPFITVQYREDMTEQVTMRAQLVSDLILLDFPEEAFVNIRKASDINSADYQKLREQVQQVLLNEEGNPYDLYCSMYYVKDEQVVCSYMIEENTGAFYPYDWDYADSDEKYIAETGEGIVATRTMSEGSFLYVENPIYGQSGEVIGFIEIGTDLNVLSEELGNMVFDMILNVSVMAILVILISMEAIFFLNASREWKKAKQRGQVPSCATQNRLLRIVVFLIFFLTNISVSFLPLYAIEMAESSAISFIPMEIMAAVPISSEVIFTAIFSVFGDVIIRRIGQRKAGVVGGVMFTAGLMLRFIVPGITSLIIGNAVMGAAQGILLLIINAVIARGNDQEKNDGFADYSAASLNGINSGAVFGGFLVIWFDYHIIFGIIGILSVLVLLHVLWYLSDHEGEVQEEEEEKGSISLLQFLTAPRVWIFFAAVVVPIIAFEYFTTYLFPIIGEDYGLNETYVGYAYLLNGLPVIFFSNFLTNYLSSKLSKRKGLIIASVIYIVTFAGFAIMQNVVVLLVSLVLLGISDSFGLSIQNSYYTDMEEVQRYGYEKSIGIYNLFDNVAQSIGSFVFSYVIIVGVGKGLFMLAALLMLLSVLFILVNIVSERKGKRNHKRKERTGALSER